MLAQERHQQIINLLEERGAVRTIDLAEKFQVTDETIRRDLQVLADNKQIMRIHGGASSLSGRPKLHSYSERRTLNVEVKQRIAKAAAELILPGNTFAFDSSTTAFELVSILPDQPYRIVTNALAVINHLNTMENTQLIATGGRYHPKTNTFVGGDSINTLQRHHVNTAFISCIGFDIERGASEGFEQQATFKERLVQFAEKVVLLIDSSKFTNKSEYFFARVEAIHHVITDSGIPEDLAEKIRAKGIALTIAE